MAMLCRSLQNDGASLFTFTLPDGRGICKAAAFLYPYLLNKSAWPYKKDVEHFESLPVRSPGLLFTGPTISSCGPPSTPTLPTPRSSETIPCASLYYGSPPPRPTEATSRLAKAAEPSHRGRTVCAVSFPGSSAFRVITIVRFD